MVVARTTVSPRFLDAIRWDDPELGIKWPLLEMYSAATWRTILSADLVSLMASIVLFWLSVGSVKGFALYLGLTTICDLLVCYFFLRPAVALLARTRWFDDSGRRAATVGTPIGATS